MKPENNEPRNSQEDQNLRVIAMQEAARLSGTTDEALRNAKAIYEFFKGEPA